MNEVGTNIGKVHTLRQGEGLATVLHGDGGAYLANYWERRGVEKRAKFEEDKKNREASLAQFKAFKPEYWNKHTAEMTRHATAMRENYVGLLQLGIVDPYKSTDPRAQAFQKMTDEHRAMAQASGQMKSQFDQNRSLLNGADPTKYTAGSVGAQNEYFNRPLADIIKSGDQAPEMELQRPMMSTYSFWSERAKNLDAQMNGNPVTTQDRERFVDGILADPATSPEITRAYRSALKQMGPEARAEVESRAKSNGNSVLKQASIDDLQRYEKAKTPLDLDKEVSEAIGDIKPATYASTGPSGGSTGVNTKQLRTQTGQRARLLVDGDPRIMDIYEQRGIVPRADEDDDGEYRAKVVNHLAGRMYDMIPKSSAKTQTESGKADAERTDSGNLWLQDVKSGKGELDNEAAGRLVGSKWKDMNISEARVEPTQMGHRSLVIRFDTKVDPQMLKGKDGEDYEIVNVGLGSEIVLPLTADQPNDNLLLNMYYESYKESKIPYKGAQILPKPKLKDFKPSAHSGGDY